jgi:hypothetical protein
MGPDPGCPAACASRGLLDSEPIAGADYGHRRRRGCGGWGEKEIAEGVCLWRLFHVRLHMFVDLQPRPYFENERALEEQQLNSCRTQNCGQHIAGNSLRPPA